MAKHFKSLGNHWYEVIAIVLLLILISPILFLLWLLAISSGVLSFVFRFPKPKHIPVVVENNDISPEQKFKIYLDRFQKEIEQLDILQLKEEVRLKMKQTSVKLWFDDSMVSIQLEGRDRKLDTGYWHTIEEVNIDIFFWFAVAALRNGVLYKKNAFGRSVGWVYSKEMSIWMGVSTNSDKHFGNFIKFAWNVKI